MTENLTGRVAAVATLPTGSVLVQDAPVGSSVLYIEDAADFDETGGSLYLNGVALAYAACDDETSVVTLASPLAADALTDDRVEVYDPDAGSVVVETIAQVIVEGTEQGGDPLEAIVDHSLVPYLPDGIRDDSAGTTGEAVTLEWRGDDLYVLNIIGSPVVFDGSVINPETLPETVPTSAPAASPSLTVKGTADGLVVRTVEPIEPTTVLTYHITATPPVDGAGEPLDFTPSAATQVGEPTRASVVLITELTDGSRLLPATAYYLRVVASNVAGAAPPSPQASGALDPSVVTDFVTGTITAGFALLGGIQVGQITIHPDTGITIPHAGGETRLPSDGSPATFSGSIETNNLDVDGGLTLNGETNKINGSLDLANVTTAPTVAPTLSQTWDYQPSIGTDTWSLSDGVSTSEWVSINTATNTLKRFSKATGAQVASYGAGTWKYWGVVTIGSTYYVVAELSGDYYVVRVNSSGTRVSSFQVGASTAGIPGIGKDQSGNIMVAWAHTDAKNMQVKVYSTAGTLLESTLWDYTTGSGITGSAGTYSTGVGRSPIGPAGEVQTWINVGGRTVVFDSSRVWDWWPGYPEASKGNTWTSDGRFVFLGYSTYRVYEFTLSYWSAAVTVGYTWYDGDAAGTGTHETTLSPTKSYWPYWWARLQVQIPPPADNGQPDDPDRARIYLNNSRQAELAAGQTLVKYSHPFSTSGDTPPTTNGFEGATAYPGKIRSESSDASGPLFEVLGNGSGRWGGLKVDALGKTTLNGDTGWIAVTSFGVGWENYGTLYAPAGYRKIGSRVFLRGLVRSGPQTTAIFSLPVGFRPPYAQIHTGIVNSVTKAFDATGDGAKTILSGQPTNSVTDHRHDVAITAYDISTNVSLTNLAGRITITTDGNVSLGDATFGTGYVSLDGISFLVD